MLNKTRTFRRLRPRSGYDVVAVLAMCAAMTGTAYASGWTGADIIDGSLTGADVQDGSIKAPDLTVEIFSGGTSKSITIAPGATSGTTAQCPYPMKSIGGGFDAPEGVQVMASYKGSGNGDWFAKAKNTTASNKTFVVTASCTKLFTAASALP